MELGKIFEKTRWWSKLLFFIPLTIILFVFAVILMPGRTKGYVQGEGTVTNVDEIVDTDVDGNTTYHYDTTFEYNVDGKDYNQTYNLAEKKDVGSKITFYYNPANPDQTASSLNNKWLWIVFIVLGCASLGYTIFSSIKGIKRQKQTDALREQRDKVESQVSDNSEYSVEDDRELTEYYFRFDGHSLMPGYLIEDKDRKPLFEGKMKQNIPFMARKFTFINHHTNQTTIHKVSHVMTAGSEDYGMFSESSWFKFDGVNIWDYLHNKGVLIESTVGDKLVQPKYVLTLHGKPLADVVMTSKYVHEEDEEGKNIKIYNKMFYRLWTKEEDLELIFLTIFAIAETNQLIYS